MELRRIVIGEDFSGLARAAARWTARSLAPDGELILVHSIELPRPPGFLKRFAPPEPELVESVRRGAGARLEERAAALDGARVRTVLVEGRPADRLAEIARSESADLIVVGEHGHYRRLGDVLGSTADQLARVSAVPVLIARQLPDGPPRRILVPVKESDLLGYALEWAGFLARRFDARLIAYYAVSPMIYGRIRAVSAASAEPELERELIEDGRNWLGERLEEAGIPADLADREVDIGDPSYEIVAAVERFDVDLIVMPSRAGGVIGDALIGSVARVVIRNAPCSVLIVNRLPSDRTADTPG